VGNLSQYFGPNGAFAEACELYQERHSGSLPADVLNQADLQDRGRLAFTLGYCFAAILKKRNMSITAEEIQQIADIKIVSVNPAYFVRGFQFHESWITNHGSRAT